MKFSIILGKHLYLRLINQSSMKNIKIIGTSHISKQSIEEIRKSIEEDHPDIVAVELDLQRAAALMQKQKRNAGLSELMEVGLRGFLFVKIGQYVQEKLGRIVGVSPGSEMKTAIELANKNNIEIAYIDQPIRITLKNFSRGLRWREKGRFVADLFKGLIFPKKQAREMGLSSFDLSKVPQQEVITKMINQLRKRYPSIYKTLIEDRNRYMVKKLVRLVKDNPDKKILTIVGAGHKEGMEKLLLKFEIV